VTSHLPTRQASKIVKGRKKSSGSLSLNNNAHWIALGTFAVSQIITLRITVDDSDFIEQPVQDEGGANCRLGQHSPISQIGFT
jgi:hypothetical protein